MVPFLLQESVKNTVTLTSLLGVYLTLGGTLAAALLAAFSSRNAAKTAKEAAVLAATTAEKVADLSRQTTKEVADLSRQTAKEVADLSAQVTKESSTLAARTAQELKDKDYKNDYHKKIIDKRLKAIEHAEILLALFRYNKADSNGVNYHTYFVNKISSNEFGQAKDRIVSSSLWFDTKSWELIRDFVNYINPIITEAKQKKDAADLREFAKIHFETVIKKREEIISSIGKDMRNLYDVDSFITTRFQTTNETTLGGEQPSV